MITMGIVTIISTLFNLLQGLLNKHYKTLLKQYEDKLIEFNQKDDELLKYCLSRILTDAINKEDYETAKRCRDLLNNLNSVTL